MKNVLNSYLEQNQSNEVMYGKPRNSAAIHLPMTLSALYRMGANEEALEATYRSVYDTSFKDAVVEGADDVKITRENWQDYLGKYTCFASYLIFFRQLIKSQGLDATLKYCIPTLIMGISSHAFHPFLRLGYALDVENKDEIIFSLAYWSAAFYGFPALNTGSSSMPPTEFLSGLHHTHSFRNLAFKENMNIDDRIRLVLVHPDFTSQLSPIHFSKEDSLKETTHILLKAFMHVNDFTLLHGVTSCHTLQRILPYCVNELDLFTLYWHMLGAVYVTIGMPSLDGSSPLQAQTDLLDWEMIKKKAISSRHDHVIKLVYTCLCQSQIYPQDADLYRYVAMRQIESPAPFCRTPFGIR